MNNNELIVEIAKLDLESIREYLIELQVEEIMNNPRDFIVDVLMSGICEKGYDTRTREELEQELIEYMGDEDQLRILTKIRKRVKLYRFIITTHLTMEDLENALAEDIQDSSSFEVMPYAPALTANEQTYLKNVLLD